MTNQRADRVRCQVLNEVAMALEGRELMTARLGRIAIGEDELAGAADELLQPLLTGQPLSASLHQLGFEQEFVADVRAAEREGDLEGMAEVLRGRASRRAALAFA